MHSASLKGSSTRRARTPGSGAAEPLGELRSASSSGITPTLSALPGDSTGARRVGRGSPRERSAAWTGSRPRMPSPRARVPPTSRIPHRAHPAGPLINGPSPGAPARRTPAKRSRRNTRVRDQCPERPRRPHREEVLGCEGRSVNVCQAREIAGDCFRGRAVRADEAGDLSEPLARPSREEQVGAVTFSAAGQLQCQARPSPLAGLVISTVPVPMFVVIVSPGGRGRAGSRRFQRSWSRLGAGAIRAPAWRGRCG